MQMVSSDPFALTSTRDKTIIYYDYLAKGKNKKEMKMMMMTMLMTMMVKMKLTTQSDDTIEK